MSAARLFKRDCMRPAYQANEHLVQDGAQAPPIDGAAVLLLLQHLGSWTCPIRPGRSRRRVSGGAHRGCESESTRGAPRYSGVPQKVDVVSPCTMPSLHKPKSVRAMCPSESSRMFSGFRSLWGRPRAALTAIRCKADNQQKTATHGAVRAPVDDVQAVQILERRRDFGRVKPRTLLAELALPLQMEEELATVHIVQDKVKLFLHGATYSTFQRTSTSECAASPHQRLLWHADAPPSGTSSAGPLGMGA